MAALSKTMMGDFKERRVLHPAYQEALEHFDEMFELSGSLKTPWITAIYALAGNGKTTIIDDARAKHPMFIEDTPLGRQRHFPVLQISAAECNTVRSFVDALCDALGLNKPVSKNANYLKKKATDAIRDAGVKVLFVDEVQDFLTNSNASGVRAVRAFIRTLADTILIPIFLVGTPDFHDFIAADRPTYRRVKHKIRIKLMSAPTSSKTLFHRTTLGMLNNLKSVTGRRLHPDFDPLEFSQRLYLVSSGCLAGIYDFFEKFIAYQSLKSIQDEFITLEHCAATMKKFNSAFELPTDAPAFTIQADLLPGLMLRFEVPVE